MKVEHQKAERASQHFQKKKNFFPKKKTEKWNWDQRWREGLKCFSNSTLNENGKLSISRASSIDQTLNVLLKTKKNYQHCEGGNGYYNAQFLMSLIGESVFVSNFLSQRISSDIPICCLFNWVKTLRRDPNAENINAKKLFLWSSFGKK